MIFDAAAEPKLIVKFVASTAETQWFKFVLVVRGLKIMFCTNGVIESPWANVPDVAPDKSVACPEFSVINVVLAQVDPFAVLLIACSNLLSKTRTLLLSFVA